MIDKDVGAGGISSWQVMGIALVRATQGSSCKQVHPGRTGAAVRPDAVARLEAICHGTTWGAMP